MTPEKRIAKAEAELARLKRQQMPRPALTPVPIIEWQSCYDQGWQGLIVPEAFAHPAKIARGLIVRIFDHLFEIGALTRGAVVLDPFSGIGTTAIEGASRGCRCIGVELEPKFVELTDANFKLHESRWEAMELPLPIVIQGDSRRLRKHLTVVDAVVSSPPYASGGLSSGADDDAGRQDKIANGNKFSKADLAGRDYGTTEGQLGAMTTGDVDAIVASPPYTTNQLGGGGQMLGHTAQGHEGGKSIAAMKAGYGETDGQLGEMKPGDIDIVVASPPYAESSDLARQLITDKKNPVSYESTTDGQLGNMKHGDGVDVVISSPPYAEIASGAGGLNTLPPKHEGQQAGRSADAASQDTDQRYGSAEGQLAKMVKGEVDAVIGSPPWEQSTDASRTCNEDGTLARQATSERGTYKEKYGVEDGQLGAMKSEGVDTVVTSPPYEYTVRKANRASEGPNGRPNESDGHSQAHDVYGDTPGNVGKMEADTFWGAARDIVAETFAVLKPGGYAVWIVKSFVRNKEIVDFPGDWRRLCEHVGFETVTEIHAMLVKEDSYTNLFGEEVVEKKERKSFFRRLAESKGSPRIDYEVVWVMVKR